MAGGGQVRGTAEIGDRQTGLSPLKRVDDLAVKTRFFIVEILLRGALLLSALDFRGDYSVLLNAIFLIA